MLTKSTNRCSFVYNAGIKNNKRAFHNVLDAPLDLILNN